jgi:hypothetical protein
MENGSRRVGRWPDLTRSILLRESRAEDSAPFTEALVRIHLEEVVCAQEEVTCT